MKKDIKSLLDAEIEKEVLACGKLEPGTGEHSRAVESASTLLKATEEAKASEAEATKKKIEPWLGLAGSCLVAMGSFAGTLLSRDALKEVGLASLNFEKENVFTMQTSRQLVTGSIQGLLNGIKKK